jgi:hypothetical protein
MHPHDLYICFMIVFLLGQFFKHVTCINVWNVCLEKALELFLVRIEICSTLEQDYAILYVSLYASAQLYFNEYKFGFCLKKEDNT